MNNNGNFQKFLKSKKKINVIFKNCTTVTLKI